MSAHSFSADLEYWRSVTRDLWTQEVKKWDRGREFPAYFVDRYAYQAFRAVRGGCSPNPDFRRHKPVDNDIWDEKLRGFLVGVPNPAISAPDPLDIIVGNPLLRDLRDSWMKYLENRGIVLPNGAYAVPAGKSWSEFFAGTPHYPGRPAIAGPTFITRLAPHEREYMLQHVGEAGVMDLYLFLLLVHEYTHALQTGEPLLNEINLACMWCDFLEVEKLWWWQRSDHYGVRFNIEYPWISQPHMTGYVTSLASFDAFENICAISTGNRPLATRTYDQLCELAWKFDQRLLNYRSYLELATNVIGDITAPNSPTIR
jgi:hypothetical protein